VPLRNWFFQIAFNLIVGLHRASSAIQALQQTVFGHDVHGGVQVLDPPDPRAAAAIASWEGIEEFWRLLHHVTSEQRIVLRLRFGYDMAVATVARKMGRSKGFSFLGDSIH
jgi:DNA-directed RNA polymerase specialized sigma24 family protein